MRSIRFNDEEYYTVKDVYTNLCVTRTAVINKLEKLEQTGDVLRIKNKRPEIYISQNGYNKLKEERIRYLDEEIAKAPNQGMKKYYQKIKDAIGKPELWKEYHKPIIMGNLYYNNGKIVAEEIRYNGKSKFKIYERNDKSRND